MKILKFELKQNIVSLGIWSGSILFFIVFYMMFYPSFGADTELMDTLFESFPPAFLDALGFNTALPLHTVLGYFGLTYGFTQLIIAIQASFAGFSILSKEERELTADFLFTKPITRKRIYFEKVLSSLIGFVVIDIVAMIGSLIALVAFNAGNEYELGNVFILLGSTFFFQLTFFSIGLLVTVLLKKIRTVLPFAMGLGFGMYIVQSVGSMLKSDLILSLTPFGHYNATQILAYGEFEWYHILISLIIIVGSFIGSYFLYQKRNIASL